MWAMCSESFDALVHGTERLKGGPSVDSEACTKYLVKEDSAACVIPLVCWHLHLSKFEENGSCFGYARETHDFIQRVSSHDLREI
jgi:hypothetical protein